MSALPNAEPIHGYQLREEKGRAVSRVRDLDPGCRSREEEDGDEMKVVTRRCPDGLPKGWCHRCGGFIDIPGVLGSFAPEDFCNCDAPQWRCPLVCRLCGEQYPPSMFLVDGICTFETAVLWDGL